MPFYRRHLPRIDEPGRAVFITWRLQGSLPPDWQVDPVKAFAAMDRLLDKTRTGPVYLGEGAVAEIVVDSIYFNGLTLGHFELHAFAVMPNHLHLLVTPAVEYPRLTKSLKGIISKRASAMLGISRSSFWEEDSHDHSVRNGEFEKIRRYIEENPVRAGLVRLAGEFMWSSAARAGPGRQTAGRDLACFRLA